MRQLGSFFHIAMNGMAASEKIFHLLDLPEKESLKAENGGKEPFSAAGDLCLDQVHFSYEEDREILHGVDLVLK